MIKRMVRAWDPEFTKLTPEERLEIESAEAEDYVDDEDIDWMSPRSDS